MLLDATVSIDDNKPAAVRQEEAITAGSDDENNRLSAELLCWMWNLILTALSGKISYHTRGDKKKKKNYLTVADLDWPAPNTAEAAAQAYRGLFNTPPLVTKVKLGKALMRGQRNVNGLRLALANVQTPELTGNTAGDGSNPQLVQFLADVDA